MALHGDIGVNHHIIGTWSAQNAGVRMDSGIYRCHVVYTDRGGWEHERRFFLMHNYDDGALVLAAKVLLEYEKQKGWPASTEESAWYDFCAAHNLSPEEALGSHIYLLKE